MICGKYNFLPGYISSNQNQRFQWKVFREILTLTRIPGGREPRICSRITLSIYGTKVLFSETVMGEVSGVRTSL